MVPVAAGLSPEGAENPQQQTQPKIPSFGHSRILGALPRMGEEPRKGRRSRALPTPGGLTQLQAQEKCASFRGLGFRYSMFGGRMFFWRSGCALSPLEDGIGQGKVPEVFITYLRAGALREEGLGPTVFLPSRYWPLGSKRKSGMAVFKGS